MTAALREALGDALGDEVSSLEPVAGGDLNAAYRASLTGGEELFVKTRKGAGPEEYRVEAAALEWLTMTDGVQTPAVVGVGDGEGEAPAFLALEWIEQGPLAAAGAEALGQSLARTHRAGTSSFGARPESAEGTSLHIGPLAFSDSASESWPEFYAEQRLLATAKIARDRGSLSREAAKLIDRVANRADDLAGPPEPPARLHGDLWSGNVLARADGEAVVIDPASYGGHREVDLAMLRLFGAPDEAILREYEAQWPLAEGAVDRVGLYQLFPLLVHAALFGSGWGERAMSVAQRYA